ncbi:MAG: hypothetical protein SWL02_09750 [Pseudomonadota bacterium]|nr:hypothetical protein [Pseudomonadota bacterium]
MKIYELRSTTDECYYTVGVFWTLEVVQPVIGNPAQTLGGMSYDEYDELLRFELWSREVNTLALEWEKEPVEIEVELKYNEATDSEEWMVNRYVFFGEDLTAEHQTKVTK